MHRSMTHVRKLKPTQRPLDAFLLCALVLAVVAVGYLVGAGWAGAAGLIVIAGSLLLNRVRRRKLQ